MEDKYKCLARFKHVVGNLAELYVEEFIDGEEFMEGLLKAMKELRGKTGLG